MTQEKKIDNLYDYINLTRIRTAMYTGAHTISALNSNIMGYLMACHYKNIHEILTPDFGNFHDFVADYYLYGESTAGWKNIILAKNFGNEQEALKDFYKLFDLFRQNPKITNAKKILFKILDKLFLKQPDLLTLTQKENEVFYNHISDLPCRLDNVKFKFEYDDILEDLEKIGETNVYFKDFINEIKTNVS